MAKVCKWLLGAPPSPAHWPHARGYETKVPRIRSPTKIELAAERAQNARRCGQVRQMLQALRTYARRLRSCPCLRSRRQAVALCRSMLIHGHLVDKKQQHTACVPITRKTTKSIGLITSESMCIHVRGGFECDQTRPANPSPPDAHPRVRTCCHRPHS